jgi:hypothetical protein
MEKPFLEVFHLLGYYAVSGRWFDTHVQGLHIIPIFKSQAVQEDGNDI